MTTVWRTALCVVVALGVTSAFALTSSPALAYEIRASASPTRSPSAPLDAAQVSGDLYVFVTPETGVADVVFYFDDVDMSGDPHRIEGNPPFDFMGGPPDSPRAFDTTTVVDGPHTISASVLLKDGGAESVHATFIVANETGGGADSDGDGFDVPFDCNDGDPDVHPGAIEVCNQVDDDCDGLIDEAAGCEGPMGYALWLSEESDRAPAVLLDGASVGGDIYVFVQPEEGIRTVAFHLDDPDATGSAVQVEGKAPYDFAGTGSSTTVAKPFDASTLAEGEHVITAVIEGLDATTTLVHASFTVGDTTPPDPGPTSATLLVSASPDRTVPADLDGSAVSGSIYVFVWPESGVSAVSFYVDDPGQSGSPIQREGKRPYDMGGTDSSTGQARPFDSGTLVDGSHVVTARVELAAGGTEVVQATFDVANTAPPADADGDGASPPADCDDQDPAIHPGAMETCDGRDNDCDGAVDEGGICCGNDRIDAGEECDGSDSAGCGGACESDCTCAAGSYRVVMSRSPDRSDPVPLDGQLVEGVVYVFILPELAIQEVAFAIDGAFERVERTAPYDLKGTPDGEPRPFFTVDLADGTHSIDADLLLDSGSSLSVSATFEVDNVVLPDQVHLAWVGDTATTLSVLWRTLDPSTPPAVQYRPRANGDGAVAWEEATGVIRPSGVDGRLNETLLEGLEPATTYEYRVAADGGGWSKVFETQTAPAAGAGDFDAIYVADTGLTGRTDGLATGTQQVVHEIAALEPLLVLLGGDYAYFNTDTRFGTLEDTIDAWFNQMRPIATRSPMMVSYGNHEALLGEGYEPWAARFPTPEGFDERRNYSFDVADVHFASIFAVENSHPLSAATLDWIEADLTAARAAGQRWLVPFFHVSPFADGGNHPSNENLRAQLGPLFEELGVAIALSSHDQAYERTYPLTDVPATNQPMDQRLRCYQVSDGVTWVKVSPGGKLSNLNKDFSQFETEPAPAWTAVRDNTLHHFARLIASSAGVLRLETYGVAGDGTPPVLQDFFEYRLNGCEPELRFATDGLSFSVPAGESAQQMVALTTNDGSAADYTATADVAWLSGEPSAGTTPDGLAVVVDASLPPGRYDGMLSVQAPGTFPAQLPVALTVTGGDGSTSLVVSFAPDRSEATILDGEVLRGDAYVFVEPEELVERVEFFLDGASSQIEGKRPFDFAGTITATGFAKPFDTAGTPDGVHTITASVSRLDGTDEVIEATFTIANGTP